MKRIFMRNEESTNLILCNEKDDESIANAIALCHAKKFNKEEYEYWGYDETNPLVKASVYRPVVNDERLWIDDFTDRVFQLQGLASDIHNVFIPNTFRFRYVGKLVDIQD